MLVFKVRIIQEEYDQGVYYYKVKDLVEEVWYEGLFVCFDVVEYGFILLVVCELGFVLQVVVVDMIDGQIYFICCDIGEIKVVCYDISDIDEYLVVMVDWLFGENG